MEIPAAAGEPRERGWKHELNSLFHRASSVYFHSISWYFYLISILFLTYFPSLFQFRTTTPFFSKYVFNSGIPISLK